MKNGGEYTMMDLNDFIDSLDYDQHLEHHGVKGMKWGQRKAKKSSGGKSKSSGGERVKGGLPTKAKVAIGVGLGLAAAAGIAVVAMNSPAIGAAMAAGRSAIANVTNGNLKSSVTAYVAGHRINARGQELSLKSISDSLHRQYLGGRDYDRNWGHIYSPSSYQHNSFYSFGKEDFLNRR